jgi:hypothetical protein
VTKHSSTIMFIVLGVNYMSKGQYLATAVFFIASLGFKQIVLHCAPVRNVTVSSPELKLVEVVIVVVGVLPKPETRGVEGSFSMENNGAAERLSVLVFGASHTMCFSLADAGIIRLQSPHFQPSVSVIRGFNGPHPN